MATYKQHRLRATGWLILALLTGISIAYFCETGNYLIAGLLSIVGIVFVHELSINDNIAKLKKSVQGRIHNETSNNNSRGH